MGEARTGDRGSLDTAKHRRSFEKVACQIPFEFEDP